MTLVSTRRLLGLSVARASGAYALTGYAPAASPPTPVKAGDIWAVSDVTPGSATASVPISGNSGITGTASGSTVFAVRGATGQSVVVFKINRASDGAQQAAFADDGSLIIGSTSAPTYKFAVSSTSTANSGTTNYGASHVFTAAPTADGSGQFVAVAVSATYSPGSAAETSGYVVGLKANANTSTSRSRVVAGVDAYAQSASTDLTTGAGSPYSVYGVRAQAQNNGVGKLTHIMGLKIQTPVNAGNIDYAWGIYIADVNPTGGGTINQTTTALHIEKDGESNAISWGTGGSTPTGGKIYSSGGALFFKGGSGTVTQLAAA